MKINPVNNVSSKGAAARKLALNSEKKVMMSVVKNLSGGSQKAEKKALIVPMKRTLPKTINQEELLVSPHVTKPVKACGYFSDSCGGGFDFCGAYM